MQNILTFYVSLQLEAHVLSLGPACADGDTDNIPGCWCNICFHHETECWHHFMCKLHSQDTVQYVVIWYCRMLYTMHLKDTGISIKRSCS